MSGPRFAADDWQRLEAAFAQAAGLDEAARAAYLTGLSDWPAELRAELAALLAANAAPTSAAAAAALEAPAVQALGFALPGGGGPEDWVGQTLGGRWRVESVIASGGMGDVLRARRVGGDYEQEVAIKVLREGWQHGSLARRFLAERRTLAALNHPHIARLLDGGDTAHGVPWLAMEFIAGETLLESARRRGLDLRARVRLMIPVCEALHHAHQRLVVHRDLKPSNVLVRDDGQPVLLDFGIAKLLDPEQGAAEATQAAQALMTPEYASPEQARGEAVGTASDLWSLGVVMYRLFGDGARPYDFGVTSRFELARRLGEFRYAPLHARLRGFPRDLDAILGMCLRPEPERRYASAEALRADLLAFLRGMPVAAHPDSFGYRARRFLRRNWAASLLGVVAVAAAAAGAAGVVWQRDLAVARALTAQRVTDFLIDLFRAPDPWAEDLGQQSLESILAAGRRGLVDGLREEPQVRGALLAALGQVYRNLGAEEDAIAILGEALAADPGLRRREPQRWADVAFLLGVAQYRGRRPAEAEATLREVLSVRRGGEDEERLASALNTLGAAVAEQEGRAGEAEALYREALGIRERLLGLGHRDVATTVQNLAALDLGRGEIEAALAGFERAAAILTRAYPGGHPDRATELNNWGMALLAAGRPEEAERKLRDALAMREQLLPPDHPHVAGSRLNLGELLLDAGRPADALPILRAARDGISHRAPTGHPLRDRIEEDLREAEAAL